MKLLLRESLLGQERGIAWKTGVKIPFKILVSKHKKVY